MESDGASQPQETLRNDKIGSMVNMTIPVVKNFLIELEEIFETETSESKRTPGPSPLTVPQDYLIAD